MNQGQGRGEDGAGPRKGKQRAVEEGKQSQSSGVKGCQARAEGAGVLPPNGKAVLVNLPLVHLTGRNRFF